MANVNEIKGRLKDLHRAKKPDTPVELPSVPLEAINARPVPNPADMRIDPDEERVLHSIICRAGFMRNAQRREGINYRQLRQELHDFLAVDFLDQGVPEDEQHGEPEGNGLSGQEGTEAPGEDPPEALAHPQDPQGDAGQVRIEGLVKPKHKRRARR